MWYAPYTFLVNQRLGLRESKEYGDEDSFAPFESTVFGEFFHVCAHVCHSKKSGFLKVYSDLGKKLHFCLSYKETVENPWSL